MTRLATRGSGLAIAGRGPKRAALLLLLFFARAAAAQDTHLLVVTGVGGDDEHTQNFHKWASAIIDAAKERGGLTDATITYLGDKPELDAARIKARSTRVGTGERPLDNRSCQSAAKTWRWRH